VEDALARSLVETKGRSEMLVPEEPPSFRRLGLLKIVETIQRRRILRGLDWILRKQEIPFSDLMALEEEAYPSLDRSQLRQNWKNERLIARALSFLSDKSERSGTYGERHRARALEEQLRWYPYMLRIADWTSALMLAFNEKIVARNIPGFEFASFGVGLDNRGLTVFGVFAYAATGDHGRDEIKSVKAGRYEFPVVVRRGRWLMQSNAAADPLDRTAACWAVSGRLQAPPREGFLTAAHRNGSYWSIGDQIPTRSGFGKVLDVADPGIDAMLVRPPSGVPQDLLTRHEIMSLPLVTAFTPVIFNGMVSGPVPTTITEVTNLFGTLSPRIPGRVILERGGQEGDSGALIQATAFYKSGVGLYTDVFRDMAGVEHGMGMHLAQIVHTMKLKLYEL